ncbi:MAG TPA: helix-hairpin-helix domain-containing protein [Cyclobacteriaceae bacterium]|nr:helix-hairpin-helix domain-containing protein [Cyclobacteriaceae bacterium]
MKKIIAFIRQTLGFSQTEANAFVILIPLMLIVIISEPVYQTYFLSNKPDEFQDGKKLDSLISTWDWPDKKTENQAKSPEKSRAVFKKRSDQRPARLPPKQKPVEKFDLNLADTAKLKTIYGIGPVIARRIALYRESLGGFIMFEQLYEVWGLDSTVVRRLSEKSVIAPGFTPVKLPINHCGEQELARHPYIRTKLARAIVNYRLQHGNFASIDDLTKIVVVDEKAFQRIKPYITID